MDSLVIHKIQDLSNTEVVNILRQALTLTGESESLRHNYSPDYELDSANLFFLLANGRFQDGAYYVVTTSAGEYVGSAGWNHYNRNTALVMTRMYVTPAYRTSYVLGHTILPMIIQEVRRYRHVWMTMNQYNKSLYTWFIRKDETANSGIANWPDAYKLFNPIGIKVVNGVDQFVVELNKGKYMTKEEKLALLVEGVAEISGKAVGEIQLTESTNLADLKLDSLDIVELQMFYEDKTGTMIPDTTKPLVTVADLLELLP